MGAKSESVYLSFLKHLPLCAVQAFPFLLLACQSISLSLSILTFYDSIRLAQTRRRMGWGSSARACMLLPCPTFGMDAHTVGSSVSRRQPERERERESLGPGRWQAGRQGRQAGVAGACTAIISVTDKSRKVASSSMVIFVTLTCQKVYISSFTWRVRFRQLILQTNWQFVQI